MRFENSSVPVVVLGCFRHGGLAIVRSLGRLGVPVYAVHADRWTPGFFSRYCRERVLWDLRSAPAEQSVRFLIDLGRRIGQRAVLVPTSDIGAMFVAAEAERLGERFIFPRQDRDLVRSLCSKREMYELAVKWNVPAPKTTFPRTRADVVDYLETAQLPVLVKPIYSDLPGRSVAPMMLCNTRREVLDRYDAVEEPAMPNLMLQEYIPGGDEMTWVFNGYFDRDGECKAAFTGRKLRNFPPYFGQGSLGICAENEHVARTTIDFMKAIGYRGPLDLGYRYDARDGRYKVHDINPRIGAMFRAFVGANGMDVVRTLYQDMTGQSVLPGSNVEGRKWIVEDCDWVSALRYWRDGRLTLKELRDSLRGISETSYFAKDDLWPVAGALAMDVHAILGRWRGAKRAERPAAGAAASSPLVGQSRGGQS
jgi:D-aspartate ligase